MKNPNHQLKAVSGRTEPLLQRLHAIRRSALPPMGVRTKPVILCALVFATAMISIILSLSWVQNSEISYLKNSSGVTILNGLNWTVEADGRSQIFDYQHLEAFEFMPGSTHKFTIQTELPKELVTNLAASLKNESVVFSLPELLFETASISTSWGGQREIARGEWPMIAFAPNMLKAGQKNFLVTVSITPFVDQSRLVKNSKGIIPPFVSGMVRYQTFQDFVASRRVGSGKQLADIGRIVLALFSVLLFVFIDSSPECFALGIFMSLKALGVVAAQRWYPDTMIPVWMTIVLPGFLLSFADFMQLYFFTQLARLAKPRQFLWLAIGLCFGTIYAWGISQPTLPGGINWSREVWRYRNIAIGVGCLGCSIPVTFICWKAKHYHRVAALIVASSGVIVQILTPIFVDVPAVSDSLWFKTWYNLFETHTPYVFALSTFINVSTLEQRVKTLTASAFHAKVIQDEMALGKTVQQAFLQTPTLPGGVSLAFIHNAATYVSGDTIFSHYDESRKRVTALMCDVTGHGVQAALKASICNALCDFIWNDSRTRANDSASDRMGIFFNRVTGMLSKVSRESELLAMVGCEVALATREVTFYRANAVFPIVVTQSRKEPDRWHVDVLSFPEATSKTISMPDPFYVLLFSDGLIDGSRTTKALVLWLTDKLNGREHVEAAQLKEWIMEYQKWPDTQDDKTMVVMEVA